MPHFGQSIGTNQPPPLLFLRVYHLDMARVLPNPAILGKTPSFYLLFLVNLCTQTIQIPAASVRRTAASLQIEFV